VSVFFSNAVACQLRMKDSNGQLSKLAGQQPNDVGVNYSLLLFHYLAFRPHSSRHYFSALPSPFGVVGGAFISIISIQIGQRRMEKVQDILYTFYIRELLHSVRRALRAIGTLLANRRGNESGRKRRQIR